MRDMVATACARSAPSRSSPQAPVSKRSSAWRYGFDLLVLDLNMPDVGGLEVIERRAPGSPEDLAHP